MSQLVACRSPSGLLLAADRRVVVTRDGRPEVHRVQKLFPLGPAAAVATSGAAVAIAVSRTLSRLLRRRAALPWSDLEAYALGVYQKEYRAFTEQGARWFASHPDASRLSYLLIGSVAGGVGGRFHFHASESHGQAYRALPTGDVLTAPRRLGLEGRLLGALRREASLEELGELTLTGLRQIGQKVEAVGAPFDLALLDETGDRFSTHPA